MPNKMKNPWTKINKSTKHESPWIKIEEHEVLSPSKIKTTYSTVHFKNLAVGALPLDSDLNTYLVGQWRFPLEQYTWEIPKGGCPENTEPLATAKRELQEETGLAATEWTYLCKAHPSNSCTDEIAHLYLARNLTEGQSEPEETEILTIKKLKFSEAVEMVSRGEITDALSIIAILKVQLILESEQKK